MILKDLRQKTDRACSTPHVPSPIATRITASGNGTHAGSLESAGPYGDTVRAAAMRTNCGRHQANRRSDSGRSARQLRLVPAMRVIQRWAMDFVQDALANGRTFRILTIEDTCTSESGIAVDTSISGLRARRELDLLTAER